MLAMNNTNRFLSLTEAALFTSRGSNSVPAGQGAGKGGGLGLSGQLHEDSKSFQTWIN